MTMEEEIIEYLIGYGMSEERAKENVEMLIQNNDLIEFYNNMYNV